MTRQRVLLRPFASKTAGPQKKNTVLKTVQGSVIFCDNRTNWLRNVSKIASFGFLLAVGLFV
jgi:hypothetical protein